MWRLAKILLPVDFSQQCVGAARYAGALADHFHSELTALHVVEPLIHPILNSLELGASAWENLLTVRTSNLEKNIESFEAEKLRGLNVKRMLLAGDPARIIVDLAHREQMDLIVMPTHGYGPFRKLILGSVTAKVLNDSDCPVWTGVHLEESSRSDWKAIRNMVCAVDRNTQAPKVLKWARDFAREFGSAVTVVHAISPYEPSREVHWAAELRQKAEEDLHRRLRELDMRARTHVETGELTTVVSCAVENFGADLLVIGRSSASGLLGRLVTHAYSLIRQSSCPVLSV